MEQKVKYREEKERVVFTVQLENSLKFDQQQDQIWHSYKLKVKIKIN